MYKPEIPKTVAKWLEKNREKVYAIDVEDTDPNENGEWSMWIYFKGHSIGEGYDRMHHIHVDTAKAFLSEIADMEKCPDNCADDPRGSGSCTHDVDFAQSSDYKFQEGKLVKNV